MTTIPSGRFVWFEHVSKDAAKAQGFYGELFHWKTETTPMPNGSYSMIKCGDHTIGGYGSSTEGGPTKPYWLSYLQVTDAGASAGKVKSLGGRVVKEAFPVGEQGTMAVVTDPLGGVFALWQPRRVEGDGNYRGHPGDWVWNELMTDDPERSIAFYKAIGGFESEAMPMGEGGTYHLLKSGGQGRAGVMKNPMPGVPQNWLPYVQVQNADQSHDKAKRLGASIKVPPTDIPNVGRFSVFEDPLGAALGILQPAPR